MVSVTLVSTPDDGSCGIGTYTGELLRELPEDVEATYVNIPFRSLNPLGYIVAAIRSGLTHNSVIHVQHEYGIFASKSIWSWFFFPILYILSRIRGRHIVVTFHGAWSEKTISSPLTGIKRLYIILNNHLLARTAHHAFFLSEEAATDFRKTASVDSYDVVPHGVQAETVEMSQSQAKKQFGYDSDTPLIVEPGYIRRQKGSKVFVDVADELPAFDFLLAGGCQDTERYCQTVQEAASENVQITGVLDDDEFHAAFVAADVVFLPYNKVTQSGIFNWAVAYDRPMLTSNEPYFVNLKEKWNCVECLETDNTVEMARHLRELHSDETRKQELRKHMAAYREERSLSTIAKQHRELYSQFAQNRMVSLV